MCRPISSVAGRRHLHSADRGQQLVIPRYRLTTAGRRAFSCAGPSAWNSLPEYLKDESLVLDSFKRSLKCFLFAMYWHSASSALEINSLMIVRYISLHLIIIIIIIIWFHINCVVLWPVLCTKVSLGICWRPRQCVCRLGQTSTIAWPHTYICATRSTYSTPALCSSMLYFLLIE